MEFKVELNPQFLKALDGMENTNHHLFITGKAGTGKSTLLQYFRGITKKNIVVLGPTGVASLNVQGQTIHSFFRFKPGFTLEQVKKIKFRSNNLYKKLDAIVIDEVSMVRADLLDCVDRFLRLNGKKRSLPFGGVQMIFIGDLYQLPPVVTGREKLAMEAHYVTPYFFSAKVFEACELELVELEKIYRQKDPEFIELLNVIRNNSVTTEDMSRLNQRHDTDFEPDQDDFCICLTSTNDAADEVNRRGLAGLRTKLHKYRGRIKGQFEDKNLPTLMDLEVKIGAQVMLLNNDSMGRWVNGSIGRIKEINQGDGGPDVLVVELSGGEDADVSPHEWDLIHFSYDSEAKKIISETAGAFTQYPLRLAWAVTIHKSQGKTFERAIIDIGRGTFASGQVYVALSRCTSLSGIVLKTPIQKHHVFVDWRIVDFMTKFQYRISQDLMPLDHKMVFIEKAIKAGKNLEIVYLKSNDEKSKRVITPRRVGQMEYQGKDFLGMEAWCHNRKNERVFRVDRILEIKEH